MRALVLKPHRLSLAGHVGEALSDRGVVLVDHVLSEEGPPPNVGGFDFVLVMGAPWSVYGEHVAPWIEGALGAIRDAVEHHVPVLGICFGAQAFAQAMGGRARPAEDHEVGWRLVQTSDPSLVPEGPWFMWHGDTFDLPPDATEIARTDVGVQALLSGSPSLRAVPPGGHGGDGRRVVGARRRGLPPRRAGPRGRARGDPSARARGAHARRDAG